jgi:hypothetical protein
MLRHRVIAQCARLAFGIAVGDQIKIRQEFIKKEIKINNENKKNIRMEALKFQLQTET